MSLAQGEYGPSLHARNEYTVAVCNCVSGVSGNAGESTCLFPRTWLSELVLREFKTFLTISIRQYLPQCLFASQEGLTEFALKSVWLSRNGYSLLHTWYLCPLFPTRRSGRIALWLYSDPCRLLLRIMRVHWIGNSMEPQWELMADGNFWFALSFCPPAFSCYPSSVQRKKIYDLFDILTVSFRPVAGYCIFYLSISVSINSKFDESRESTGYACTYVLRVLGLVARGVPWTLAHLQREDLRSVEFTCWSLIEVCTSYIGIQPAAGCLRMYIGFVLFVNNTWYLPAKSGMNYENLIFTHTIRSPTDWRPSFTWHSTCTCIHIWNTQRRSNT